MMLRENKAHQELTKKLLEECDDLTQTVTDSETTFIDIKQVLELRRKCRILIAEDDSSLRLLLRNTIEALGYLVETVEDGRQAATILDHNRFQMLVTDMRMPRMNGVALASLASRPGYPILVVTGNPDDEELLEFINHTVAKVTIVPKPFDLQAIRNLVNENLGMIA